MPTPLQILQQQFGYSEFRLEQEAIINNVLAKKDTFALMPTGGGKSLCYQVPALIFGGLTIVISPLIALMKDQVDALRLNGVRAAFLNSTQSNAEQEEILNAIKANELKLLYLAPESNFFKKISSFNVSLIAIDEAHCISHWGHDFRPEYLMLAQLKRALPQVPIIALTATADHLTRKDILQKLELYNPSTFISSFNRANIRYTVEPKRNSFEKLIDFLDTRKEESGIIYCLSRASTESLAQDLTQAGYAAQPYHAGLEKEIRARHQEMFLRDDVKIIVATVAFGMGIDKSNVRYVVHMDLPKNIESYYQETGRAGRDGLQSDALLFFSWGDVSKLEDFARVEGNTEQSEIMLKKLKIMGNFGDLKSCRRKFLLNYFAEETIEVCGNCDNCQTEFERFDGTIIAQKALSAVARTGQNFGLSYLIDFLRGSSAKAIRHEHKELKTYGIGADISKENWYDYFKDLIAQGYLKQTEGQFPIIIFTEKSNDVLRGNVQIELFKVKAKTEKKSSLVNDVAHPYLPDLLEKLKQLRLSLAQKESVPAYIIFSDATLVELATYLPQDDIEMQKISGVGDVKLQKYGTDFLNAIHTYCEANQLDSRINLKTQKRAPKARTRRDAEGNSTYKISLDMFLDGMSIAEIARQRTLAPGTIEGHLLRYLSTGEINLEDLVSEEKVEAIRQAIAEHGATKSFGELKEMLGEDYTWGQIRAVHAMM